MLHSSNEYTPREMVDFTTPSLSRGPHKEIDITDLLGRKFPGHGFSTQLQPQEVLCTDSSNVICSGSMGD